MGRTNFAANTEKKLHLTSEEGQKGGGRLPTGGRELCAWGGQRNELLYR